MVRTEGKNGAQSKKISSGEIASISPDRKMVVQSFPLPQKDEDQPAGTIVKIASIAILQLTIKDLTGNAYQPNEVIIQSGTNTETLSASQNGIYVKDGLSPGPVTIKLKDSMILGAKEKTVSLQEGENHIDMSVGIKTDLTVQLVNDRKQPISNANVRLEPQFETLRFPDADLADRDSNAEGIIRYDPISTGNYTLKIEAEVYLPHEETIAAEIGGATRTVLLSQQASVSVRVTDGEDNPIHAARVKLQSKPDSGHLILIQETSKATGQTVFKNVPSGDYGIQAEHGWYEAQATDLTVSKDYHEVHITMTKKEYTISGRVLDKESGEPVPGITVVAYNRESSPNVTFDNKTNSFTSAPDAEAVSDKNGYYELTPLPGGTYNLGIFPVKKFIYVPFQEMLFQLMNIPRYPSVFLSDETNVKNVDIALLRSWTVSGKVLHEDGSPIEGAKIGIKNRNAMSIGGDEDSPENIAISIAVEVASSIVDGKEDSPLSGPSIPVITFQYGFSQPSVSQADGTYNFISNAYIPQNARILVNADHPLYGKYADRNSANIDKTRISPKPGDNLENVDLVYSAKTFVSGKVVDTNGQPVDGGYVAFSTDKQKLPILLFSNRVKTNEDGTYRIALEPGTYHAQAGDAGNRYYSKETESPIETVLDRPIENLDFVLTRCDQSFRGVVIDEEGNPAVSGQVMLFFFPVLKGLNFNNLMQKIDEQGRFEFPLNLEKPDTPFEAQFTFISEEYDQTVEKTSEWGKTDIQIITRKKETVGKISGNVLDLKQNPVPEFQAKLVSLVDDENQQTIQIHSWELTKTISHPEGAFLFEKIPTQYSPYQVVVQTISSKPTYSQPVYINPQNTSVNVTITIDEESTFTVTGQIVDAEGKPFRQQDIQVGFSDRMRQQGGLVIGMDIGITRVDANGFFRLTGIPLEGCELTIRGFALPNIIEDTVTVGPGRPNEERNLGSIAPQLKSMAPDGQNDRFFIQVNK